MNQLSLALTAHRRPTDALSRTKVRVAITLAACLCRLSPTRLVSVLTFVRRHAKPATTGAVLIARRSIESMSVRCAGEGCLQRSIAIALFCRLEGQWPDWKAGVRVEPFRAHAWVEAEGAPVGETAEVTDFSETLSVPAVRRLPARATADGEGAND